MHVHKIYVVYQLVSMCLIILKVCRCVMKNMNAVQQVSIWDVHMNLSGMSLMFFQQIWEMRCCRWYVYQHIPICLAQPLNKHVHISWHRTHRYIYIYSVRESVHMFVIYEHLFIWNSYINTGVCIYMLHTETYWLYIYIYIYIYIRSNMPHIIQHLFIRLHLCLHAPDI